MWPGPGRGGEDVVEDDHRSVVVASTRAGGVREDDPDEDDGVLVWDYGRYGRKRASGKRGMGVTRKRGNEYL